MTFELNQEIEDSIASKTSNGMKPLSKAEVQYMQDKATHFQALAETTNDEIQQRMSVDPQIDTKSIEPQTFGLSESQEVETPVEFQPVIPSGQPFCVSLEANPSMPVNAGGEYEASEIYKRFMGITSTDKQIIAEPWDITKHGDYEHPIFRDAKTGSIMRILPEREPIVAS